MRSIRHPHILIFYGAGVNSNDHPFLVTELMVNGSLRRLLDSSEPITWSQRFTFARDIASGMRYLHSKFTVHRDLKAENCFLDARLRVKVSLALPLLPAHQSETTHHYCLRTNCLLWRLPTTAACAPIARSAGHMCCAHTLLKGERTGNLH
jgi:serine/threonine protein kinase